MDRREFLKCQASLLACGVVGGGALSLLGGCATLRYADYELAGQRVTVRKESFGEHGAVLVDVPERLSRPLYLQRLAGDEYLALSTRCTHRGCQVEPEGGRLVCPCHGSEFTPSGTVVQGPADRDLLRFAVEVAHDRIHIELPPTGDHAT